ncbi:MAG: hypothetical protein IKY18_06710 [Oscillospiraceae bacterium]|nr:hypothetical protein [Oscillospiraceae bacterium]
MKQFTKKGGDDMSVQNTHFICEICGGYEMVLSSLNLRCNYGSENDGEELKLRICGKCADRYMSVFNEKTQEKYRGDKHKRTKGL